MNKLINDLMGHMYGYNNLVEMLDKEFEKGNCTEEYHFNQAWRLKDELRNNWEKELDRFERDLRKETENETTLHK